MLGTEAVVVGVTIVGVKTAVVPMGRPDIDIVTDCVNPFRGVTVRMTVPYSPAVRLNEVAFAAMEKSGGPGAAFACSVTFADVEAA